MLQLVLSIALGATCFVLGTMTPGVMTKVDGPEAVHMAEVWTIQGDGQLSGPEINPPGRWGDALPPSEAILLVAIDPDGHRSGLKVDAKGRVIAHCED